MPSSATTRGRLEKQGSGENSNTWGHIKLNGVLDLVDEQIDGVETIALTGNLTLSTTNYASDQQRNKAYRFTGAGAFTVTLPAVEWVKFVINDTTGTLTVTNGTNSVTIAAGRHQWVASNGTAVYKDTVADDAATSATAAATSASNAATSATNASNSASSASTSATNASNSASSASTSATNASNSATLSSNWAQKTDGTVDGTGFSAKYWAQQAAGSSGLPLQTGQAGEFLKTNGTSASWEPLALNSAIITDFTASGTFTKDANAKFIEVILWGGGAGGGGGHLDSHGSGGSGAAYACATFSAAEVAASETVTIGAAGAGGAPSSSGGNGGTTSFGSVLRALGGLFNSPSGPLGMFSGGFGGDGGQGQAGGNTRSSDGLSHPAPCPGGGSSATSGGLGTLRGPTSVSGGGGAAGASTGVNAGANGLARSGAVPGTAGGGGSSGIGASRNGGNGGNGGSGAGGGAGGGASSGFTPGAGGAGGAGFCRVIQHF
jgi:hypothetical protein